MSQEHDQGSVEDGFIIEFNDVVSDLSCKLARLRYLLELPETRKETGR